MWKSQDLREIQGTRDQKIYGVYSKNIIKNGLNGTINKKVDLIIGGPPCQAYSIAGRAQDKDSMKNDYRNYLFESFVKIVDHFKPSIFLFENVPGMLSASPGNKPVKQRIHEAFNAIGYSIKNPEELNEAVLNSSDFGVAQNRRREITQRGRRKAPQRGGRTSTQRGRRKAAQRSRGKRKIEA